MPSTLLSTLSRTLRALARAPRFTLVAIATLSLSIALALAVIRLAAALLWQSPPGIEAVEQLRTVVAVDGVGRVSERFSLAEFREDILGGAGLERSAAYLHVDVAVKLHDSASPRKVTALVASSNLVGTLGTQLSVGRQFETNADSAGGNAVALVTNAFATRQNLGPGDIVHVNGVPTEIVAVTEPRFRGVTPERPVELVLSVSAWASVFTAGPEGTTRTAEAIGRAFRVVTRVTTDGEEAQVQARLASARLGHDLGDGARLRLSRFELYPPETKATLAGGAVVVGGACLFVLLVACTNVAHLMGVRAWERRSQSVLKWCIGSSPGRLFLEGVSESAVVVVFSLVLGGVVSGPTMSLLLAVFPADVATYVSGTQSVWSMPTVVGALAIGAVAVLVSGVAPARIAARAPAEWAGEGRGGSRRVARMMTFAVFGQACVAVALLTGALWAARGITAERGRVDEILERDYLLFEVDPVGTTYTLAERALGLDTVEEALRSRRDVKHVAYARVPLLRRERWVHDMMTSESTEEHLVYYNVVSRGYFEAVYQLLQVGRVFDSRDTIGSPPVLIVTEALARHLWPTGMAVGQHVTLEGEALPRTVVGIVADPAGGPVHMAYLSYSQAHPVASVPVFLHVEPMGAPTREIAEHVEETVRRILPDTAIPSMRTVTDEFASATRLEAILAGLASGLGGVALLLTASGVFAGVSYAASRRRREWAIRSAVGAGPRAIVWHAVRDGVWAAGLGGLSGAIAASVALRAVRGRFGVSSDEGMASLLAIGIVLVTVIVAIAMPAVRAAQTRSSELLKDV